MAKTSAPMAKPKAQRAAPPVSKKRVTGLPSRLPAESASLGADDPLAITEADAPLRGAKDYWRTPPEIGGLSFASLAELIFTNPDKAAKICQATLKADNLGFWDSVYRVIALGMLWARILAKDDAAWAAFEKWPFWSVHSNLSRGRVLSYCLMLLYGSHQGNQAHRANAHARQVKAEFDDEDFLPEDLPRQLYLRGGLDPKPLPAEDEDPAAGTANTAAVAAEVGQDRNGGEDVVSSPAQSETNGAGRNRPPGEVLPPSEDGDSLAAALSKYAQKLSFRNGQDLTIEVHISIDEDSLEYRFDIHHVIE